MPPDWTYRSRCLRWSPPDVGWGTALGRTWRIWRTCRTWRDWTRFLPIQGESIGAGIGNAALVDDGERCQAMRLRFARADDVRDLDPARQEPVRDEAPVTAPGHRLGTHR